jgi:hypothetical protein
MGKSFFKCFFPDDYKEGYLDGIVTLLVADSAVCDQKPSQYFVSHQEESMAGHMGVNGVY